MKTYSDWDPAINDVFDACTARNMDTFQTTFDTVDIGIVTKPHNKFYHQMVMFKNEGRWVLLDSNGYDRTKNDAYTKFQHDTAQNLSRVVGQGTVEVMTTRIQKNQRNTNQWLLDAHGLCHAFSTLTAILLIKKDFNFSNVMDLLGELTTEENAYLATVFMCSCVHYYMPTNWSLLRETNSVSGGGARSIPIANPYALTGLTNIKNPPLFKDDTTYKSVAFYIHKGHCKHFLPSLVYDKNKNIFDKERWDILKAQYPSHDFFETSRVHSARFIGQGKIS